MEAHDRPAEAAAGEQTAPPQLSTVSRVVIAVALAGAAVAVAVHLGMVFLHVAPPNTVSKKHQELIGDYIYPEFEQNWKLFAPNPLQTNIHVEVRARVRGADGLHETGWTDLSAQDADAIAHNPFPSHTEQNELRRAWEFYVNTHNEKNEPLGDRGALSKAYMKRIVMLRLGPETDGGRIESVQLRGSYTPVAAPSWSGEKTGTDTTYRTLSWWQVDPEDLQDDDLRRWEDADQ
ncbi:DUF5819 family protein [Streptomyces sp. NPDC051940]|uniref:DUF5819 family protein n=1 Tax=Streptomyces sp. NPDC051940 TaxID=3155675 RepID=UPI00343E14F4